MMRGVPAGIFEFKVEVHDFKVFTKINATATIRVIVKEISEEAVFRSGSIRLAGRLTFRQVLIHLLASH